MTGATSTATTITTADLIGEITVIANLISVMTAMMTEITVKIAAMTTTKITARIAAMTVTMRRRGARNVLLLHYLLAVTPLVPSSLQTGRSTTSSAGPRLP